MPDTRRHQQQLPRCERPLSVDHEGGVASQHPDKFKVRDHSQRQAGAKGIVGYGRTVHTSSSASTAHSDNMSSPPCIQLLLDLDQYEPIPTRLEFDTCSPTRLFSQRRELPVYAVARWHRITTASHRAGVLHPVREQTDPRFDCAQEAFAFGYREADAVPVELPVGAALIFDGYLLHRSLPNTGHHGMRRALVNHYMSAESVLPWFPPTSHEAMGTLDHRDIHLVAGNDPYASKGTVDLMHPQVHSPTAMGAVPDRCRPLSGPRDRWESFPVR
jgi:Phytanoyl-CoA dioxygenase (PhyH)